MAKNEIELFGGVAKDAVKGRAGTVQKFVTSKSVSGQVGKSLAVSGTALGAAQIVLWLAPFVTAGLIGPWYLPLAMIALGMFMAE